MLDTVSLNIAPALVAPLGQVEQAYRRLTRIIQGMPQAAFDFRGRADDMNSAAMLVVHMALTDLEYFYRIKGEPVPAELAAAYGPYEDENGRLPVISGVPAAELLARYRRVIDMIEAYFAAREDAEATREVTIPWWPEPATVRYVLWHMTVHSIHHQSHIQRLQTLYQGA